ncbi:MAG: hypothetical protein E7040_06580 [Lentisphaerae bacterium]|nr:hypothetical protein [Lentisphaerota bacterium]
MKKSIIALSSALLFTVSGLIAGEVSMISLKGNDPNFTKIFRGGVRAKEVTADGFIIKGNGPVYTYNTEKAIDPNAGYELTIKVKYVGKKKGITFGGGFMTNVGSSQVFCHPETITELAEDFTKGDNELIVKDASKWKKGRFMVAFDAKDDASDLPNRKLTRAGIVDIKKQANGTWLVEMKSPEMKLEAKKGTKVRVHYQSNTWNTIDTKWIKSNEVFTYKGTFTGVAKPYPQANKFWPGTKGFGIVFFTGGLQKGEYLVISEITLKKITK